MDPGDALHIKRSHSEQPGEREKRTCHMSQRQHAEPCASIQEKIDDTEQVMKDIERDLENPADLTPEQIAEDREELEKNRTKLRHLHTDLRHCREQHRQDAVVEAVPSAAGSDG